jgi:hypothetical protein
MSLQACVQCRLVVSVPTWCAMPAARGEKSVRSTPRFLWMASWFVSMVSRISSSETMKSGLSSFASFSRET